MEKKIKRLPMLLLAATVMAAALAGSAESRKARVVDSFEYTAMSCRAHSASITEFGAVGDGTTSNTKAGVRIKTGVGRGGFVKDIYVRRMTMHTMKWAFWMTGNYGSHADGNYDPNAMPEIKNINYRDMTAENVSMAARLEGIAGDPFTQICISNVTIAMAAKAKKVPWTCTDVGGITSGVSPRPCDLLPDQGPEKMATGCDYPTDSLPIDSVELKTCSSKIGYFM